ncbi:MULTISPECIES: hypothetical protein [unclassified Streptococcus]|uniref:hypothetical protein n=1 Tax=unclassified Streptococcus TaxID=2608887 RepID=UPI001071ED5A|nr:MULTISPECIES: hypothetical protein [unclassified Streptococcus]MBF0805393.1 hypothetical protein [Streptococcus sp. 19428wA2_WM07]TFU29108.1 hypothetical protein E4T71_01040 [Streptococcus sp. WM07]
MNKALIVVAKVNQIQELETLLKSVILHNQNLHFYIAHNGIAKQWFGKIRKRLAGLSVDLTSVRLPEELADTDKSPFRYTLDYHVEEESVLLLSPDMVVTGDLGPVFQKDLGNILSISSVQNQNDPETGTDGRVKVISHHVPKSVNLKTSLSEENISNKMDVSLLMKGRKRKGFENLEETELEKGPVYPIVIHFDTPFKPWSELRRVPYQNVWWYYANLTWDEVILTSPFLLEAQVQSLSNYDYVGWVYTYSDELLHLETLARELPNIGFVVAAPTEVSDSLMSLLVYPNITLVPGVSEDSLLYEEIVRESDFYLDINGYMEVGSVVADMAAAGKPILAFEETKHGDHGQKVFSPDNLFLMIETIRHLEVENLLSSIGISN